MKSKHADKYYQIGKRPRMELMSPGNKKSWKKINTVFNTAHRVHYDTLIALADGHTSKDVSCNSPAKFITKCIVNGWIKAGLMRS